MSDITSDKYWNDTNVGEPSCTVTGKYCTIPNCTGCAYGMKRHIAELVVSGEALPTSRPSKFHGTEMYSNVNGVVVYVPETDGPVTIDCWWWEHLVEVVEVGDVFNELDYPYAFALIADGGKPDKILVNELLPAVLVYDDDGIYVVAPRAVDDGVDELIKKLYGVTKSSWITEDGEDIDGSELVAMDVSDPVGEV